MKRFTCVIFSALAFAGITAGADLPAPLVTGLKNPESVAIGMDGRIYVTVIGEFDKDGDGGVMVIENGKAVPFASGLDDPKGMVAAGGALYVTDKKRVLRINRTGQVDVLVKPEDFPTPPLFLNDICADERGTLYVTDTGDRKGGGGAIYRIIPPNVGRGFGGQGRGAPPGRGGAPQAARVELVADSKRLPALKAPNGVVMAGGGEAPRGTQHVMGHLYVLDFMTGELNQLRMADGTLTKVADGFGGADGITWDHFGRLYVTDWQNGKVFVIPTPGARPMLLAEGFQAPADLCLDRSGQNLLVPDMKAGTITAIPTGVPGATLDATPLALETGIAFPDLEWTGWQLINAAGQPRPVRPLILTHAGDGSNRNFVSLQQGVIHVFPNDQKATKTKVFLDIQSKVRYSDNMNEEGMLGLAFHPDYKRTGELFVFYTDRNARLTNVLSRFKVSKDDPDRADPASEEVLFRIEKPFWNHDGGTVVFGPDGYLYFTHGDGGDANDPFGNGQNLNTLLGKVLRIDVNHKEDGKNYAIPKDNPFVGRSNTRPEIWSYGHRNIWRMAFDRVTGRLWAGEVGQNIYEEINLVDRGKNYGWNLRESFHPFGSKGVGPQPDMVEPIWEYHHDVGKSITGGGVYRGKQFPELAGAYLYADYVSGKIWALRYDEAKKRVVANQPISDRKLPIMSFGEDERGEMYLLTYAASGQGIYRIVRSTEAK